MSATGVGPVTPSQITSGRYFASTETNAKVAVLDASYAKQHKLKVGSTITIDGKKFSVVGIATAPTGSASSNVYIPAVNRLGKDHDTGDASNDGNQTDPLTGYYFKFVAKGDQLTGYVSKDGQKWDQAIQATDSELKAGQVGLMNMDYRPLTKEMLVEDAP